MSTRPGRLAPAVVLLTRDLRLADNPALAAGTAGRDAVVLFVLDDRLLRSPTTGPNRLAFLLDCLTDLRASLRSRGGELYLRRGDPASVAVAAARAAGASEIHLSSDVTEVARRRRGALFARCADAGMKLVEHPGIAIVAPDALRPKGGGDHYRVFTPYWRAWTAAPRRHLAATPELLSVPDDLEIGEIPTLDALASGADPVARRVFEPFPLEAPSPNRDTGGESAAWKRLGEWRAISSYVGGADDLATDGTSRVSAHLHFGCVSPAAIESWALDREGWSTERPPEMNAGVLAGAPSSRGAPDAGIDAFVRQLCWRDFYLAVTCAFPAISWSDYRQRPITWRAEPSELAAWKQGRTGVDLVDAAMHQLLAEGFVHNRARLVASSYLVKTLRHDWREGAAHYMYWLSDGDVASNSGNWQWMAGTGNDTRPNRVLNPERQAKRFDRDGSYRARYLGTGTAAPLPWA